MRVQRTIAISIPPDMIKELDEVANRKGMTRSAYVKFAIAGQLQTEKALNQMPELLETLKNLKLTDIKQLEDVK